MEKKLIPILFFISISIPQIFCCLPTFTQFRSVKLTAQPTTVQQILNIGTNQQICSVNNVFFNNFNNQNQCASGITSNIGFIYTMQFYVFPAQNIGFRFGEDFGWGGVVQVDGTTVKSSLADLRVSGQLDFNQNFAAGCHTVMVYGAESCCDGGQFINFSIANGPSQTVSQQSLQQLCQCHSSCTTCDALGVNGCTSCPQGTYLTKTKQCVANCPCDTYADNNNVNVLLCNNQQIQTRKCVDCGWKLVKQTPLVTQNWCQCKCYSVSTKFQLNEDCFIGNQQQQKCNHECYWNCPNQPNTSNGKMTLTQYDQKCNGSCQWATEICPTAG